MLCSVRVAAVAVVGTALMASPVLAGELERADSPVPVGSPLVQSALSRAWVPDTGEAAPAAVRVQARRRTPVAGPNIGAVGLGGVAGLSEFEIGPSFRYWFTDRFGMQAHLGFSGDNDPIFDDVEYIRFEPTFIVAIGDFGNDAVNVRPYAGGGLRIVRTDIGRDSDVDVRPAAVGGVEFGFRGAPRLKVSAELSLAGEPDFDDRDFPRPPKFGGARVSGLVHYFFD